MKTHIKYSLAALSVILCLLACGKNDNNTAIPPIQTVDKISVANNVAKLWKNGVAVPLTDGFKDASANSVYVTGNDVYIVGYENNGSKNVAKIWKNGMVTSLTDGSKNAQARSVFISGNDVYVAGYEYDQSNTITKAVLWKNGIATSLTDGSFEGIATSVYVINTDVYVAGYSSKVTGGVSIKVATLWKNGLTTALSDIPSSAASIYVSANDVYVAGEEHPNTDVLVKIWKNGSALPSSDNFKNSVINSIFVSGSDIYTVGKQVKPLNTGSGVFASIWKNNTLTNLTDKESIANSVFVAGNDVYVAGFVYSGTKTTVTGNNTVNDFGNNIAQVWKNGVGTSLTDGTKQASANSVFVSGNDVYVVGFELGAAH
jgi:sulfur transfer complex TusBCD TusB component (DsrH family)